MNWNHREIDKIGARKLKLLASIEVERTIAIWEGEANRRRRKGEEEGESGRRREREREGGGSGLFSCIGCFRAIPGQLSFSFSQRVICEFVSKFSYARANLEMIWSTSPEKFCSTSHNFHARIWETFLGNSRAVWGRFGGSLGAVRESFQCCFITVSEPPQRELANISKLSFKLITRYLKGSIGTVSE